MSAISHATTRKTPGGGGFLLGIFIGLLVGLAIALGIALYLNKTPIPFASRKATAEDQRRLAFAYKRMGRMDLAENVYRTLATSPTPSDQDMYELAEALRAERGY